MSRLQVLTRDTRHDTDVMTWTDADTLVNNCARELDRDELRQVDERIESWADDNLRARVEQICEDDTSLVTKSGFDELFDDARTNAELIDKDAMRENLDELREEIRDGSLVVQQADTLAPDVRGEVETLVRHLVGELRHELRTELLQELRQELQAEYEPCRLEDATREMFIGLSDTRRLQLVVSLLMPRP